MNPKVDEYLSKAKKWQKELQKLRTIILDCPLTEEFKWRAPCYTFQNSNVVLIQGFKDYCWLAFFKGVLLHDAEGILMKSGENTQSVRILKFANLQDIMKLEATLKAYIYEAIEIEKAGLKVTFKKNTEIDFVQELQSKLDEDPVFKSAFNKLTPGRQRAYHLYFSEAKQSKTRTLRIEKYKQQIINGKGLNDCICGLSKKLPYCDGSHKYINK